MTGESKFLTRKEIASLIEESVDVVRKNEKRWGLQDCRAGFSKPIKYWRTLALRSLTRAKILFPSLPQ